jgi:Zn-dependent protease with chaperone function
MPISLTCRCKNVLSVPERLIGKSTLCPGCGEFLDVIDPDDPAVRAAREAEQKRKAEEPTPKELKALVRDAIDGDIKPVRRTAGYRVGVAVVAAAMLALPALYVGLILLVGVGLYWHATTNYQVFRLFRVYLAILFYVGPLLVGLLLLVFMIKPLLAPPPRSRRGKPLRMDKEQVLAVFVEEIARACHAPGPRRVEVDCNVNASASLGRGLFSFFGHDLTLTIGLPLVVGLNAQQLAGVLAHEFGHFAQGAGMRLTFVVRTVNAWFARVVYERDDWDEQLHEWCKESGFAGMVAWATRVCVIGTRAILWVFMMAGHGISCFMLRRMEYDADKSEARLVGTRTFEKTFRRLARYGAAAADAHEILERCWIKDRFPDDFPTLVVGLAGAMSDGDRRRIDDELEEARAGLFDTHPSFAQRVAAVEDEDPDGIMELDLPATALFKDLPKLSEAASLSHYRGIFGGGLQASLRPVSEYLPATAGGRASR